MQRILAVMTLTLFVALPVLAQEQVLPQLTCRTGVYAASCIPLSQGKIDYLHYINAKGGINGVKIRIEECETGYSTDQGVECYERLKSAYPIAALDPLSTGIAFAMTEKLPVDKVPLISTFNGVSISQDGGIFKWNFPLLGHYWQSADIQIQHLAKLEEGFDKLKGKKIAAVYLDVSAGNEPVQVAQRLAQRYGFSLTLLPVPVPGLEQKSIWLQVRQLRPDHVLLWGFGAMNPTALREAAAVGFPRSKILGWGPAGTEPDVKDVGTLATGYKALALSPLGVDYPLMQDVLKTLYDNNAGTGSRADVGSAFYTRGMLSSMMVVEGIRRAQEQYGFGQVMTGEQVRWGLENLNIDAARLRALGLEGEMRPFRTTCSDHMGSSWTRIQTWDGQRWVLGTDWYEMDKEFINPMVRQVADRYAAERGIQRRDAADCLP